MRIHASATVAAVALIGLLAGCTATETPSTGDSHAAPLTHVHAIVHDPSGDGFLLGTHEGIYAVSASGDLGDRVSAYAFDAMGLTETEGDLVASGHPGADTPAELGSGNLGIIRSSDAGGTWDPVAFTGEKDFHSLATSPDGTVYGLATDGIDVLASADGGSTWSPTGGEIMAFSLVVDSAGAVIGTTPDGMQISTDGAATFQPLSDAPELYPLAASPNHELLVGVDAGERIWVRSADETGWEEVGTVHGAAQAIAITDGGDILVADDSGLTLLASPLR